MNNAKFRNASATDLPNLVRLFRQSEAIHQGNRPDLFSRADEAEVQHIFDKFLGDPAISNLILEVSGEAIGYARYRIQEVPRTSFLANGGQKQATIEEIVVSTESRRRGFAQKILSEIERRLNAVGVFSIKLTVFAFNTPAQKLYESLGYRSDSSQMSKRIGDSG